MRLKIYFFIFFSSLLFQRALAFDANQLQLSEKSDLTQSFLEFSFQSSQLSVEDVVVKGTGLKADFIHLFKNQYSFQAQIMASLQSSAENSMTALSLFANYSLFKSSKPEVRTLFLNEKKLMTETNMISSFLDLGLGISQFYLNGTKGVYSLSGPAANISYHTSIYSTFINFGIQSATVQVEKKSSNINTFFLGVAVDL